MQSAKIQEAINDIAIKCEELDRKDSNDSEVQEAMSVLLGRIQRFEDMKIDVKNSVMEVTHGHEVRLSEDTKLLILEDREVAIDGKI